MTELRNRMIADMKLHGFSSIIFALRPTLVCPLRLPAPRLPPTIIGYVVSPPPNRPSAVALLTQKAQ